MGYGFFIRGTVQNPVFLAVYLSVSYPRDLRRRVCTLTRFPLAADPGGVSLVFNIAIGAHLLFKVHPVYGPAHPAPWRRPLVCRFAVFAFRGGTCFNRLHDSTVRRGTQYRKNKQRLKREIVRNKQKRRRWPAFLFLYVFNIIQVFDIFINARF